MKILITGSEGHLMQALIPRLLAQGHTLVGVDNLYRHGVASDRAGSDYELVQVDLADRSPTIDIAKGFDAVFIAAAKLYGVGGFNHYCADILSDDTAIQGNLLRSCVKHNVKRVVYISSSMVYETCIQDMAHPVSEDLTLDCTIPQTDYGLSKLFGERLCYAFARQYGIEYTIWRPFNIITPTETAEKEQGFSHVFADFMHNILAEKMNPLPIIGSGEQIRCFTWIDDVARVIADYSFDQRSKNQAFNVCNVEPISMKQLAQMIYFYTGSVEPLRFETTKQYADDVNIRIPSVDKLSTTFGKQVFQSTEQSIRCCVENYLA